MPHRKLLLELSYSSRLSHINIARGAVGEAQRDLDNGHGDLGYTCAQNETLADGCPVMLTLLLGTRSCCG